MVTESLVLSLSRTWRITSASLRDSASTGDVSSCSARRIRANVFGLGYACKSGDLERYPMYLQAYCFSWSPRA